VARPIVVQTGGAGGSSAAGLLLMLVAIVGLVALFSGNLERWIAAVAGPAGGPEGLYRPSFDTGAPLGAPGPATGAWGQPVPQTRPSGAREVPR
jgi:hypothetical protein